MTDQETPDPIQNINRKLDVLESAMKDMFQLHSNTTMLLTILCAQMNPEQTEQIKTIQDDLEETRQRMTRYFYNWIDPESYCAKALRGTSGL